MTSSYNTIAGSSSSYKEGLELAKSKGYTHLYRWINSDLGWTFFASSYDEAYKGSIDLYLKEKKMYTVEDAENYMSDVIDIITIEDEISAND